MKKIYRFFTLVLAGVSVVCTSCQDDYDPIGNNKPAPVLKLDSKFVAIPGTGGSFPINVTSNVENIAVNSLAPWVTGSYTDKVVTLTAPANTEDVILESYVQVATVTGQNEAQIATRVIQGNDGTPNIFATMLRTELDTDWKVLRANGTWSIEDNSLRTNSPGDVMSVMAYTNEDAKTVRSATKKFTFSVDVKSNNTWAGVVFHAIDAQNFFYVGLNVAPTSVFVFVDRIYQGGSSPMAMDPGIVLSEDRAPFLRCEILTTTENPDAFTLNVYELKTTGEVTLNTDISVVQKLVYSRTFNSSLMAEGGHAGVWGKVGGGDFRRFVLTTN